MSLSLLAQQVPSQTLAGDSGWVGAGLLGLVLAWLLFWHLPALQKQLTEILKMKDDQLAAKDAQLEEQSRECEATIERITARFDAELKENRREREEARKEREAMLEFMRSRACLNLNSQPAIRAGG